MSVWFLYQPLDCGSISCLCGCHAWSNSFFTTFYKSLYTIYKMETSVTCKLAPYSTSKTKVWLNREYIISSDYVLFFDALGYTWSPVKIADRFMKIVTFRETDVQPNQIPKLIFSLKVGVSCHPHIAMRWQWVDGIVEGPALEINTIQNLSLKCALVTCCLFGALALQCRGSRFCEGWLCLPGSVLQCLWKGLDCWGRGGWPWGSTPCMW